MNASERATVAMIAGRLTDKQPDDHDVTNFSVRLLLMIIDRNEELATVGLTAEDIKWLEWLQEVRSGIASLNATAETTRHVVAKLQAQLADARQLQSLLLSDPPPAWESVVLQVREETAREIAGIVESLTGGPLYAPEQGGRHFADVTRKSLGSSLVDLIRRRYGLREAKGGETQPISFEQIGDVVGRTVAAED